MSKAFSNMKRNNAVPAASLPKKRPGKARQWRKSINSMLEMDSFEGDPLSDKDMRLMLIAETIERRKAKEEAKNRISAPMFQKPEEGSWDDCVEKQRKRLVKALFRAILETDVKKVSSLLKRGVPVDIKNEFGETIFMRAAGTGNIPLLEEILKYNPDIEARSKNKGDTPIMWAAESGKTKAVLFLHKAGVKINARNNGKKTALMLAAWEGHLGTVSKLLKLGADPKLKDSSNRTALDYAELERHIKVIKRLSSSK